VASRSLSAPTVRFLKNGTGWATRTIGTQARRHHASLGSSRACYGPLVGLLQTLRVMACPSQIVFKEAQAPRDPFSEGVAKRQNPSPSRTTWFIALRECTAL
jgi:hypothetical protein